MCRTTKKGFSEIERVELVEPSKKCDLIVNTLPDSGFIKGKINVWWDLETAEYQLTQYFNLADYIFYPNHKNIGKYETWKDKSFFLPLATDPSYFHYYKVPMKYDIVFVGREDMNRESRVEGLNVLEGHCLKKGYTFLRTNSIKRGKETSKVISSGKLTIQIAGLRNLEQRVFENSPIRPQLVDVQEDNEMEMKLIDPDLKSFVPFYYTPGDWHDLLDKVDYYLAHPRKREQIVKNARELFFTKHTYKQRAERILEVVGLGG